MTDIATPEFLSNLKALYPAQSSTLKNPWFLVAAVAFSASNLPEAVPLVFKHALNDLVSQPSAAGDESTLLLVRKLKDALFKSGVLCGYPKVDSFAFSRFPSLIFNKKPGYQRPRGSS